MLYLFTTTCDLQEWEVAKIRQDKALDNIEKGLGVLKGLGEAMGENLGQQDVLLSEIDSKANRMISLPLTNAHHKSASVCQQFIKFLLRARAGWWLYGIAADADGSGNQNPEDKQREAEGVGDSGESPQQLSLFLLVLFAYKLDL